MNSPHDFKKRLPAVLIVLALLSAGVLSFSSVASMAAHPALPAGIEADASFNAADLVYLRTSLRWLQDYLPEWYAYVTQAQPLVVSVDEEMKEGGVISRAKCCTSRGAGSVVFGEHLGQWPLSEAPFVEGMQAQQIQFLSVLIHEVTHVRDQRAGRIGQALDWKTCIEAESSANAEELEFTHALANVQIRGDASTLKNYRLAAAKHQQATEENAEGISWKIACINFYPVE